MGEVGGRFFFMFCTHSWVPRKILGILSSQMRENMKIYPPLYANKKNSGAFGAIGGQMQSRPPQHCGHIEGRGVGIGV